jgi:hypothetical protein
MILYINHNHVNMFLSLSLPSLSPQPRQPSNKKIIYRSSDDHSPGYERTSFYDRVSTSQSGNRNSEASTEYIRRNSYHSNDIRGRQRERHFKNSPYSLIVDR